MGILKLPQTLAVLNLPYLDHSIGGTGTEHGPIVGHGQSQHRGIMHQNFIRLLIRQIHPKVGVATLRIPDLNKPIRRPRYQARTIREELGALHQTLLAKLDGRVRISDDLFGARCVLAAAPSSGDALDPARLLQRGDNVHLAKDQIKFLPTLLAAALSFIFLLRLVVADPLPSPLLAGEARLT